MNHPRLIDLFCGAGGMSLGFAQNGFRTVWANDFNKYAAETYNRNFGAHCIAGDINDILGDGGFTVPEADVVIGGPPCQGFSLLNQKRDGDPRKQLWRPFMEVVERSGAAVFVMENVPQLLNTLEHEEIVAAAVALGFETAHATLNAADYGVPQTRTRAFIVGCRDGSPSFSFPPSSTHKVRRTVRDAIGDLAPPVGTAMRDIDPPYDLHFGRNPTAVSARRYRAVPKEGMNRFDLQRTAPDITPGCWIRKTKGGTDLFGRLWWDRPAFTIRTEFFKPEKGRYLHPEQHRPITHREAARFQSFPDDFVFTGSKLEIAKQIGNAVPPLLAAAVARSVHALWSQGVPSSG